MSRFVSKNYTTQHLSDKARSIILRKDINLRSRHREVTSALRYSTHAYTEENWDYSLRRVEHADDDSLDVWHAKFILNLRKNEFAVVDQELNDRAATIIGNAVLIEIGSALPNCIHDIVLSYLTPTHQQPAHQQPAHQQPTHHTSVTTLFALLTHDTNPSL